MPFVAFLHGPKRPQGTRPSKNNFNAVGREALLEFLAEFALVQHLDRKSVV